MALSQYQGAKNSTSLPNKMMQHSITKRKTLIFACFGIALGLCIGTVLKNYRALEIVKRCQMTLNNPRSPFEIIGLGNEENIQNSQKNLVFIGVMTAKGFIEGRAKAVFNTWGKEIPGRIAFFSSEGSHSNDIPVIDLKNVDDRYPPQKKSFMMLYYMYEHFIDKFEWFIRADDDVYIDPEKMERFLRSIDSSKPQFIGQAGKGNSEEFGLLSLEFDENFCMGGPGVILSGETLRRVAPHIPTCLKNLYSSHEDVEVGRCVQKFAGIPCTWNYEMQYILKHNSSGRTAYTGKLKRKDIHNAISLHPIKQGPLMYRLHAYIQGLKAEQLRQKSLQLHRDIKRMVNYLEISNDSKYVTPNITLIPEQEINFQHFQDHDVLGINPDLKKFTPKTKNEVLEWAFLTGSIYSTEHANPKTKINSAKLEGLQDVLTDVMENINNYSRQRGRVIEFREVLYGYNRLDVLHGQDIILDLLLIYKKYRGKKMTVPVRRHLYVQRAFTGMFIKAFEENFYNITGSTFPPHQKYNALEKLRQQFSLPALIKTMGTDNVISESAIPIAPKHSKKIVFVLPISGRLTIFKRFLQTYEKISLQQDDNCDLLVMIFNNNSSSDADDYINLLSDLKNRYVKRRINYIQQQGKFSRGLALDKAARSSYIQNDDIIFFIDVDMNYTLKTLQRIRFNTIQGQQVYLPIVFSQYSTKYSIKYNNEWPNADSMDINNDNGYFRQYGFGICSIYKSDIMAKDINGYDTNINGWGLEDVRFLEKIVKLNQHQIPFLVNTAKNVPMNYNEQSNNVRKLNIFRSPDPSLVHIYHDIHCDKELEPPQYNMCLGTKANSLGSTYLLEHLFYTNSSIQEFIKDFNIKKQQQRQHPLLVQR